MNIEGKIIANRYQIMERIGNRRNGYSIQIKGFNSK